MNIFSLGRKNFYFLPPPCLLIFFSIFWCNWHSPCNGNLFECSQSSIQTIIWSYDSRIEPIWWIWWCKKNPLSKSSWIILRICMTTKNWWQAHSRQSFQLSILFCKYQTIFVLKIKFLNFLECSKIEQSTKYARYILKLYFFATHNFIIFNLASDKYSCKCWHGFIKYIFTPQLTQMIYKPDKIKYSNQIF